MFDYDVIVLGGGSAGTAAAAAAASAGASTLMINDGELGGLCILRGCMPTKAMLASAHAIHDAQSLEPLGASLEGRVVPDFARIMRRKGVQVERFKRAKIQGIEAQPYEVLDGRGAFAPGGGVEVGGRGLAARRYVISTGSVPVRLPVPGYDRVPVMSSDDVMRLTEQPSSLLVYGAGPIGLELGQFFARIGTRVVLVNRSKLLWRFDAECGAELHRALDAEEQNLELVVPGTISALHPKGGGLVADIAVDGTYRRVDADALLVATGRAPAVEGLGLEHVGLLNSMWRLNVDDSMQTANPDIYVAGDTTGSHQILHLANQEGAVAGHNAAVGRPERRMDYRLKMSVVFTDPPFAQVGATEAEARDAGADVIVGRARLSETGRAITMETRHGLWKLFADRRTGEILGSSVLGPRGDDLIHTIAVMMHHGGTIEGIFDLPWYHPTLSEVLLNLGRDLIRQTGRTVESYE